MLNLLVEKIRELNSFINWKTQKLTYLLIVVLSNRLGHPSLLHEVVMTRINSQKERRTSQEASEMIGINCEMSNLVVRIRRPQLILMLIILF
jgi:hypothetical protein